MPLEEMFTCPSGGGEGPLRLGGLLRRRAAGIDAEPKRADETPESPASNEHIQQIAVDAIVASPFQPRVHIDEDALKELAASIEENGLLQPIVVRPVGDTFELVTGERRWRASQRLGWLSIPAIVRELDDEAAAALAMIENLQREDLTAVEEAHGYRKLLEQFQWTQSELARRVGKSQSTIANKLRLLRLPSSVQERIIRQSLTERHARALLRLEEPEAQAEMAKAAEQGGWTVEETERRVEARIVGGDQPKRTSPRAVNRRVVRVFKDLRLFRNSIMQVVREMERTGLVVDVEEAVSSDTADESWQIQLSVRRARD